MKKFHFCSLNRVLIKKLDYVRLVKFLVSHERRVRRRSLKEI